ncbi:hypothetical protein THAOC_04391 [Thalassiosira oceanica]|uniref:Sodium/calcium exchanger membrane region domain-containing protein n=1 Tax=Thalassiosira oceanica TaxID=159749 RepID=K0T5B5_THAOC|nr:hypothetical protein THAOC_04391 [Thalassiosira oceanica]|eukprot:EJK73963.1 hypothetical protein THAOC_04391 [Thalassiosira oceanica]
MPYNPELAEHASVTKGARYQSWHHMHPDFRSPQWCFFSRQSLQYKDTFQACQFAHKCNDGEGVMFPIIFCDGDGWPAGDEPVGTPDEKPGWSRRRWSHHNLQFPVYFALSLLLLLLFRLLNSTTDEFFSPGLEHFSLQLGLPPRFAGVTLLALGNGAPDVAATMNAILGDVKGGYQMALGELTGVAMFAISIILGVIVVMSGNRVVAAKTHTSRGSLVLTGHHEDHRHPTKKKEGIPCQGPLLRDAAVLVLVCTVSVVYLERGVIDMSFVYTMLGLYTTYVLIVGSADAYHVIYSLPKSRREQEAEHYCCNNDLELHVEGEDNTQLQSERMNDETSPLMTNFKHSQSDCTPTTTHQHQKFTSSPITSRLLIEAISNYSGDSQDGMRRILERQETTPHTNSLQKQTVEATTSGGWPHVASDGSEPLVIFHPHHAVHPHHEGGPTYIRRKRSISMGGDPDRSSCSGGSNDHLPQMTSKEGGQLRKSSSCDASRRRESARSEPDEVQSTEPSIESAYIKYSSSWREACTDNACEFREHWHDFFIDIYQSENSALEIALHSIELPFTIARKVRSDAEPLVWKAVHSDIELSHDMQLTNPVPCDGYYCRPLVSLSLIFSPMWLKYYFADQFDIDLLSGIVGKVILALTIGSGLAVFRYAPGGDGPLHVLAVVPLTLYGFAISAFWLDAIADKLVEVLELIGILLSMPAEVTGLTLLALGNASQDMIADLTLARKGLETMAITGCLAGPIFNFCVGLGFGFWALMKSTGQDEIRVEFSPVVRTGFYFSITTCFVIIFTGLVVGRGSIKPCFGYGVCALYCLYVLTALRAAQ